MVGRGFYFDFSRSKCSLYANHSQVYIFGLIIAVHSSVFSHVQTSSVKCDSGVVSSAYQHCVFHKDGVHDLDCFGQNNLHNAKDWKCVWKPGKRTSQKTYTLIIQQKRKYCREHSNISALTEKIELYETRNVTAQVFENREQNCTKAFFSGTPHRMVRCGPPRNVTFRRHSGKLHVNVNWQQDRNVIPFYSVQYKTQESPLWNESVQSQDGERCTVERLNSSLVYSVRIRCVSHDKCSQCPWSEIYTVPQELTAQPVLVKLEDTDLAHRQGRRLIVLTWKFPTEQLHDGYYVSIGKASGESPWEGNITTQPELRLILSYSEYQFNITVFNNASASPAVSHTVPPRQATPSVAAGALNVTVHNSTSLTVSWKDDLVKSYVCFCVEWARRGRKAAYMSFYENANNHKTFGLNEPLQPHERYSLTLHTRPNRDTCNLKRINNSESTYGATLFYLAEGTPLSAPTNVSSCNVTHSSAMLQWSSIPEEQVRGFLLGYVLHYNEYHQRETRTETNITVDSALNSYELRNLKSGTVYQVQVSGFTRAGSGVRSAASFFDTNHRGYASLSGIIAASVILAIVLIFGSPILKRAKAILWPSIPHPGDSIAVQKIDRSHLLNLLEMVHTLQEEEWDANNLQLVEKEAAAPDCSPPPTVPLLRPAHDERTSSDVTSAWTQRSGEAVPRLPAATVTDTQRTEVQSPPFTFSNGYTTMEMFQQVAPQSGTGNTTVCRGTTGPPGGDDVTLPMSTPRYLSQSASSLVKDNEETATIL